MRGICEDRMFPLIIIGMLMDTAMLLAAVAFALGWI